MCHPSVFFRYIMIVFLGAFHPAAFAQEKEPDPDAEKALNKVVLTEDFGDFRFQRHEIVTLKVNDRVPGLNGLMFVYYETEDGQQVMLSVQWFREKKMLLDFFRSSLEKQKRGLTDLKQKMLDGGVVWGTEKNNALYWTDAENIVVSLGGKEVPAKIRQAYLKTIPAKAVSLK